MKKHFSLVILVLALIPFAFLQFHSPQFFLTHDGPFHIERTFNYVNALKEGNFLPSWTRLYNSDFGSPVFLYLFPLPYWISSFFYLLGINLVSVLKLDFLFWQIIAAGGMFLWLKKGMSFPKEASLVGAIFYLYSPINIAQVFVRGSLRELAGTALFPFVLYFLKRNVGISAIVLSAFLLSDGLSVLTFSPILLVYLAYIKVSKKIVLTFVLSFLIASFIYLPFLFESKFLRGGVTIFTEHLVYWWQYFDPHWGFGFSVPGTKDSLSFQVGIVNLLAFFSFVFLTLKKKIKLTLLHKLLLACLAFYFLLMTYSPVSLFLGRAIPLLALVQLPWRFLIPVSFIFSFLAASLAYKLNFSKKLVFLLLIATMAISFRYLRTNQVVVYDQKYLTYNSGDATAYHEFIPVWRDSTSEFSSFPNKIEVITGEGEVSNLVEKNNSLSFNTSSAGELVLRINTLYYPGWEAFIDNKEVPITITTNKFRPVSEKRDISGLMSVSIAPGDHDVVFRFTDTPIRQLGKILSIAGVLITLMLLCKGTPCKWPQ